MGLHTSLYTGTDSPDSVEQIKFKIKDCTPVRRPSAHSLTNRCRSTATDRPSLTAADRPTDRRQTTDRLPTERPTY